MQVAMVKGLKRYLAVGHPLMDDYTGVYHCPITYAAPTDKLSHLMPFLGDVNSLDDSDSPDPAICMRESAHRRSSRM